MKVQMNDGDGTYKSVSQTLKRLRGRLQVQD